MIITIYYYYDFIFTTYITSPAVYRGWFGSSCTLNKCSKETKRDNSLFKCSGHGLCVNDIDRDFPSRCLCDEAYTGDDCSILIAPILCMNGKLEVNISCFFYMLYSCCYSCVFMFPPPPSPSHLSNLCAILC
jgi:hypothetical protein